MQAEIIVFPEEEMKLRDEDKKWFADEIARQLNEVVDSFKPHGWHKLVRVLRELGPLAASIGIVLTLLGITATAVYFAVSESGKNSEFRGATTEQLKAVNLRLSDIENTLKFLRVQTVAQKYSGIPVPELKIHRDELATARKTLSSLPPDTPNYWPAAFQVIQLASQSTFAAWGTIAAKPESLLSNVTSRPAGEIQFQPNQRFFLKNHIEGIILENSIVRFDPDVELVNDVFINCVFILPVQENPSRPLQEIGKTLLASDLTEVTLNAS